MLDFLLDARADDRTALLERSDGAAAGIDPARFRDALAQFATGVTVVTTLDRDGEPRGFTANSFTSVSLDPPLVLVCVSRRVNSYPVLTQSGGFVVNILAQGQRQLSQRFASKEPDKFAGVAWAPSATGAPILDGALAWLECLPWRRVTAGDHVVLIGEVVDLGVNPGEPLAFFGRAYGALAPLAGDESAHR
jgi:flavin reductase (DIM6/NTAB) family NADH-FMN oxidoreductase RutF